VGKHAVGLLLGTFLPPERIRQAAQDGEHLGYDEVWLAEDYFFTGGVSSLAAALSATQRLPIGTGVVSGLVRHPAVLAMEIATLARMYPGRVRPGIALGHPPWVRQMGLYPRSPLGTMRECVTTLRALLAGEEVTLTGETFAFDDVKLTYPPTERVPIYMGGVAPKMLRLGGEIADGNIVPLLASPAYVSWARTQIEEGAAGREMDSRPLVVFVFFSVAADRTEARERVRSLFSFYLSECLQIPALLEPSGVVAELEELVERGGAAEVERALPAAWIDEFAVVGEPAECADKIRRYFDAGATSVVLYPLPAEQAEPIIQLAAQEVLPLL
jgi:alkanesulfonate monooxygenase SsuD/methylene tetrahydromethanopterin reductase-like flavin-dependent oxidoreductase (luciferase family)